MEELRCLGLRAFAVGIGDEVEEKELDVDFVYGSPETWCLQPWSTELREGCLGKQTVCFVGALEQAPFWILVCKQS